MKKMVCLVIIVFLVFSVVILSKQAHAVRVKFSNSLSGKIVSSDFNKEQPTITVEYNEEDKYYENIVKTMKLRITEDTRIFDSQGEKIEKSDLNVGDIVSVSYRIKFSANQRPLWKIAQTITVTTPVESSNEE